MSSVRLHQGCYKGILAQRIEIGLSVRVRVRVRAREDRARPGCGRQIGLC